MRALPSCSRGIIALAALLVLGVAAGCGGRGGGNGLSAEGARFAAAIRTHGVTLVASGRNCSGLYGRWKAKLRVGGRAKGAGETAFTLAPGREAEAPVSFGVRVGFIHGRASGTLHVRASGPALHVRGRIRVKVPFRSLSQDVAETIPVTRGPVPGCGLTGS